MASYYEPNQKTVILAPKDLPINGLCLEEDLTSEYAHTSLMKNNGIGLQFINSNSATVIGGIRLKLQKIKKAPAYLSRYELLIKKHAGA